MRSPTNNQWMLFAAVFLLGHASEGWSAPGNESSASLPTPVYYRLVLDGAMFSSNDPGKSREIVLDLEQVGDRWNPIYGISRNFNMAFHRGALKEAKVTPQEITLRISTDITPDKWIPPGEGDYTVTLTRPTPDTVTGKFKGKFNGVEVSGPVTGMVYAPKRATDFVPLQPREHPRLLFRKGELPALREKAKTPLGKAAMARMAEVNTPAALGVLYHLTGERSWAEKALKEGEEYLAGRKPPNNRFVPRTALWGQLEELALLYDLCYDVASDDFKARYRAWISDMTYKTYFAVEVLGVTNWHVVSNHVANVYSGITLSGLALFDEPSSPPALPSAPFLDEVVPPAKDFKPEADIPVEKFVSDKSPTRWIRTHPLRAVNKDDPREVFYGLENVHPKPGTQTQVGDFLLTFEKMKPEELSQEESGGLRVRHMIEAGAKGIAKEPLTMCLYTVIDVTEPGAYVLSAPCTRGNLMQVALAGKLLADGQVVRLEKGLYPLMCMIQWRIRWSEVAPRFCAPNPGLIDAWKAKAEQLRQQHQTRVKAHANVLETWKRSGGGDPVFTRMLRLGHFTSWLHCTDAVGKGGFQGEVGHYHMDACSGHAKLWTTWRRTMGYDLSPNMEYPDFIPRKLVAGPQDISGTNEVGNYFPWLFPAIREEWKPEVLAAWNAHAGVKGAGDYGSIIEQDPVRAFLHYPLDMKPAPVGTRLPLVWQAPDLGYYAFRSGWDDNAFIAQVLLKNQIVCGWNGPNAGTYRLRGLGQDWACGTTDRMRTREQENVVLLPESDLEMGARGHLTYFKAGDDRTIVLTADLNEIYESQGLYEMSKYGHVRRRVTVPGKEGPPPPPSGITGSRALAFDYSGLSGSPCLYVVVDRIDGGANFQRSWLFQPPGRAELSVKPVEKGFLVTPENSAATLRGFFAHPATVAVFTEPSSFTYVKAWGQSQGTKVTVPVHAVRVASKDHFFFVATVSAGDQPQVQVDGAGMDAKVTVGKRTIKFDGSKIVLGTK